MYCLTSGDEKMQTVNTNRIAKSKLIKDVIKYNPLGWSIYIIFTVIQCSSGILNGLIFKLLIDAISGYKKAELNSDIFLICAGIVIVSILNKNVFRYPPLVYDYLQHPILLNLKEKFIKKLHRIPIQNFDKSEFLQKLSIATEGVSDKLLMYISEIPTFFAMLGVLVFAVISLTYYSWIATIVAIAASCLVYYISSHINKKRFALLKEQKKLEMESNYYAGLFSSRYAMIEIRIFNLGNLFADRSVVAFKNFKKEQRKLDRKSIVMFESINIITSVFTVFIYWFIIVMTSKGKSTLGDLFYIITLFSTVLEQCASQVKSISDLKLKSKYIDETIDIMNMDEIERYNESIENIDAPYISLEDVCFTYDDEQAFSIKNINLTIESGETVAILGENGSGKTTLIKLLCGLLVPDSGKISIGGLSPTIYMNKIGAVFQDYSKYNFDFKTNVALGNISEIENIEKINDVVLKSGSESIVADLPYGYNTYLNVEYDRNGVDVSEGQWQRIKLAKMLMKSSRFYILDEPSARLDSLAEYNLFKNIREITKGATTILVSHRIGFARLADKIIIMNNGEITEYGTHAELISYKGEYFNLYNRQIKYYYMEDIRNEKI